MRTPRVRPLHAAGAVVLRGEGNDAEVLIVHRPHYHDWSLPKGKPRSAELLPVTAVREVGEETGIPITLGTRLGTVAYPFNGRTKIVEWWRGYPLREGPLGSAGTEVDKVQWVPVPLARKRLSYADDVDTLDLALRTPATTTLLIVRHSKAMSRSHWSGKDSDRRLTGRGREQSAAIADVLAAFGVEHLASSPSTRCMETFKPYAKRTGLQIKQIPEISEEGAHDDPAGVLTATKKMLKKAHSRGTLAICGHRPVLPAMFEAMDLPYQPMRPAEFVVVQYETPGKITNLRRFHPLI